MRAISPVARCYRDALKDLIAAPIAYTVDKPQNAQIAHIRELEALARHAVRALDHRLDIAKRVLTKSVERAGVQARHYATQYGTV